MYENFSTPSKEDAAIVDDVSYSLAHHVEPSYQVV